MQSPEKVHSAYERNG